MYQDKCYKNRTKQERGSQVAASTANLVLREESPIVAIR